MSTPLLQYRAWQGEFRSPRWAIWPIARVALTRLLHRRLFWVLYAAAMLLFLMFFFGAYLLDWAETQIPAGQIQVGKFATDSERIVRSLRQGLRVLNGSQETFGYFFFYQGLMVMIVLALAGSVMVGDDYNQGSLPFFLAKPITRWHYLVGKGLAVAIVVNLLTTLPALALFAQHGFDDLDYFFNPDYFYENNLGRGYASWPLLLGILGHGLLLSTFLSVVLVAVASWMRRTMPLILVWASLFLFMRMLANILVEGLQYNARWRLLDLWNSLSLLGRWCLGFSREQITPRQQPEYWEAALVLIGVVLLCLTYLNQRTRAVEIVR